MAFASIILRSQLPSQIVLGARQRGSIGGIVRHQRDQLYACRRGVSQQGDGPLVSRSLGEPDVDMQRRRVVGMAQHWERMFVVGMGAQKHLPHRQQFIERWNGLGRSTESREDVRLRPRDRRARMRRMSLRSGSFIRVGITAGKGYFPSLQNAGSHGEFGVGW
jgi:hypothetical protein